MQRTDRRDFLKQAMCTLAGLAALPALRPAPAVAEEDYKALVCIFLSGGSDSFNMVIPQEESRYARYAQIRGDMAITREKLLPLGDSGHGLHPAMTRMQQLYTQGYLAVVGNVGVLNRPISHGEIAAANSGQPISDLPQQLGAHNSQQDLWMLAGNSHQGWAARAADQLGLGDLVNITVADQNLMQQGGQYKPFSVSDDIYSFQQFRNGDRPGNKVVLGERYEDQLQRDRNHANRLVRYYARMQQHDIDMHNRLSGILDEPIQRFDEGVHEPDKPLGLQLELVTRLLEARQRGQFPSRQIYFVRQGGWDTHNEPIGEDVVSDNGGHKVSYLDRCLGQFYDVLKILGLEDKVITFTASEFGRTVPSNGRGTDHGWGGHAFVCGNAVRSGIYGTMPDIGPGSPDMLGNSIVPTTSVEQYLAALVNWLGDGRIDLDAVFPNLHTFGHVMPDCIRG